MSRDVLIMAEKIYKRAGAKSEGVTEKVHSTPVNDGALAAGTRGTVSPAGYLFSARPNSD